TGGGTSGGVTLNLDLTKVPQLGTANSFSGNQSVTGTVAATSFSGSGAGLTNLPAASLTGTLPNAALSGTYTNALTFSNASNIFAGNGSGLSSVTASGLAAGTYAN